MERLTAVYRTLKADNVHPSYVANTVLVLAGIRPAHLMQPIDHHYTTRDRRLVSDCEGLVSVRIYAGHLILPRTQADRVLNELEDKAYNSVTLGTILGYPFADCVSCDAGVHADEEKRLISITIKVGDSMGTILAGFARPDPEILAQARRIYDLSAALFARLDPNVNLEFSDEKPSHSLRPELLPQPRLGLSEGVQIRAERRR
jgi:hypothetical protein